jgi:hypothetical protein
VADFVLTPERHDELGALLNDTERLRAEYPQVSDYLETGLRLPGIADQEADRAFSLRLVHYMTGGPSENPYWDIVGPSVFEHDGRRVVNGGQPEGSGRLSFAEMILQGAYAYAIPSPETLEWISHVCGGRRVVELGAGRGYWAAQLARAGLVVDAYDSEPPDKTENVSFLQAPGQSAVWHPVAPVDVLDVSPIAGADDVLFLCWPPGWGNTMASSALAAFERAGGQQLVFIGEPKGGKTGDDAFFDALSAGWALESDDTRFVSWWDLNDVAQSWVRR